MVSGEPVEISEVREAINEVDDRILALLRQRYDLAVRAHEIRSRVGAGRNATRENEVISRVRFRGGYPVEVVERIWRALFDGSPTKPGSPE